jgi:hypothetical protein
MKKPTLGSAFSSAVHAVSSKDCLMDDSVGGPAQIFIRAGSIRKKLTSRPPSHSFVTLAA